MDEEKSSLLVTVLARGGSRRLKRKAMRRVNGLPLIWYTLDYARRLGLQDQTAVVTDDDAIATYALDYGVDVVREPPIGDDESTPRALWRAVHYWRLKHKTLEAVVNLTPTCPVRSLDLVQRCLAALTPQVNAVVTALPVRTHPERCLELDEHNYICSPTNWGLSQTYKSVYESSGCVGAYQSKIFSDEPRGIEEFWGGLLYKAVIHNDIHCDIDTQRDLDWFEFLLKNNHTIWNSENVYYSY